MSLGKKLKELREKKGKTQLDISKFLGVTYQTIYKYEKDIAVPPADAIVKLAEYFNVSTDYLLGRTNVPNSINESIPIAASTKDNIDLSDVCDEDKEAIMRFVEMAKNKGKK